MRCACFPVNCGDLPDLPDFSGLPRYLRPIAVRRSCNIQPERLRRDSGIVSRALRQQKMAA
jgi:hypothetical protein